MRKRENKIGTRIAAMGAILLLVLVVLIPLQSLAVETDYENEPELESETEYYTETHARSLSVETYDDYAEIESTYEDEITENALSFHLETGSNPRFELEYSEEIAAGNYSTEKELSLYLVFEEIIEYIDENADGMWSPGEEVVQTVNLDDYDFSPPSIVPITKNGINGYKLETHTLGDFTFKLVAYVYEGEVNTNGITLRATDMKFDINILNFPYYEDNSKLGLKIDIESEREISEESGSTSMSIEVETKDASAFFSWAGACTVDGVDTQVLNKSIATDEEGQPYIYLFYTHGDSIIHDPILGVRISTEDTVSVVAVFALGFLSASAIAVVMVWWRKKNGAV